MTATEANRAFARAGYYQEAVDLLDHFKEHRSDEWPATATLADVMAYLAEQCAEERQLFGEAENEDGEWTWRDTLANQMDNHRFTDGPCEACD
jgi:hypothetical protein